MTGRQMVMTCSKRKPRRSRRGPSDSRLAKPQDVGPTASYSAVRQARKSNRETWGRSPSTRTRGGHIPRGQNRGPEPPTVLTEPLPVPGVGRQRPRSTDGATAHQNLPRSRLSTRPAPVPVGSGRWHGPCRARRNGGPERIRSDGRLCCGRATGRVSSHKRGSPQRTGVAMRPPPRRGAHEPGTPSAEEVTAGAASDRPTPHGGILVLQRGEDVTPWPSVGKCH